MDNEFYDNIPYDDIAPEMENFGEEYHSLESDLTSTYTDEQMKMYIALEAMREGIIANLKESFYKKGYSDAISQLYNETEELNWLKK